VKIAMKEIFAAASMMKHKHVVRYYNSWVESGTVFIQNEFCDGGSLEASINNHRVEQKYFSETQIRKILSDISKALKYIHSKHLAHLDVKPDNILMTTSVDMCNTTMDTCIDTFDVTNVTYKLADFGHIAPVYGKDDDPEEGDCRYMAPELLALEVDRSQLTCADIFSLGLTMYETSSLRVMPCNSLDDPDYSSIKDGNIPHLENYSADLNAMMVSMVKKRPDMRPRAEDIIDTMDTWSCDVLESRDAGKSRSELCRELEFTRERIQILENQLHAKSLK